MEFNKYSNIWQRETLVPSSIFVNSGKATMMNRRSRRNLKEERGRGNCFFTIFPENWGGTPYLSLFFTVIIPERKRKWEINAALPLTLTACGDDNRRRQTISTLGNRRLDLPNIVWYVKPKQCTNWIYREINKGLYVVARNFFLLLLNCSAWPCLGPA